MTAQSTATDATAVAAGMDGRVFQAIALSIQPDGDDFLVGDVELGEFYQFPKIAVLILAHLRDGATIAEITASIGSEGAAFDVAEFVETLVDIGFVHERGGKPVVATPTDPSASRWTLFRTRPRWVRALFSWPVLVLYVGVIVVAIACAVRYPQARLDPGGFFIESDFTVTLLLLLAMSSVASAMHEAGHILAAARWGIASRLGIGTRLWSIVAEADISGILSLPKRQRYLPLSAGMLVDVFNIGVLTIVVSALVHAGGHSFAVNLLQALVLQITVTLIWQFNIFLRTDVYFLLCTWLNQPDLDRDARLYLTGWRTRIARGLGRRRVPPPQVRYRSISTVRWFAAVWLIGRVLAVAMLLGVFLPTMIRYGLKAYHLAVGPKGAIGSAIDIATFVLLSVLLVAVGMVMWFRQRGIVRQSEVRL